MAEEASSKGGSGAPMVCRRHLSSMFENFDQKSVNYPFFIADPVKHTHFIASNTQ